MTTFITLIEMLHSAQTVMVSEQFQPTLANVGEPWWVVTGDPVGMAKASSAEILL
jgi:hypothetical protein